MSNRLGLTLVFATSVPPGTSRHPAARPPRTRRPGPLDIPPADPADSPPVPSGPPPGSTMSAAPPRRQLSFSIDSILAEAPRRHSPGTYSPYKDYPHQTSPHMTSVTPTSPSPGKFSPYKDYPDHQTSPHVTSVTPTSPSYGTEALDARLREFYCDGFPERDETLDDSTGSHTETDQSVSPPGSTDVDSVKFKTKKKTRTVFSRQQVFYLEAAFDAKRYLSSAERSEIATSLNLSETQVKVWFQNRRNKWKAQINGDGKPASPDSPPVVFPPFLCSALANAHVQRAPQAPLPGIPYFRQSVFF